MATTDKKKKQESLFKVSTLRNRVVAGFSSTQVLGLEHFFREEDVHEFVANLKKYLGITEQYGEDENLEGDYVEKVKRRRIVFAATVAVVFPLTFFFSSFMFLVPLVHGVGGWLLHRNDGWQFYQPGKGGVRFVALSGVGWTFYALAIALQLAHLAVGDFFLVFSAFICGLLALSFVFSSLFAFKGVKFEADEPDEVVDSMLARKGVKMFNSRLQRSVLMHSGETPSGLWWAFISLQLTLSFVASWVLLLTASLAGTSPGKGAVEIATTVVAGCSLACTIPVTHAIGGKWRNFKSSYSVFQPFVGGTSFVTLQALGWSLYGLTQIMALASIVAIVKAKSPVAMLTGAAINGFLSEALIIASLFYFKDSKLAVKESDDKLRDWVVKKAIDVTNIAFGPGGNWKANTRKTTLSDPEAWKDGEARLKAVMQEQGASNATGEQYLVVGCGFVGKRLVRRLLERGETKIRVFDLNPNNPFKDIPEVEYVIGDVTKYDTIAHVSREVDVVYATFALIRFMDRLPHQAALSYHVNVTGTKVLFKALAEVAAERSEPLKVVVTSSSHATTDELSEPRRNRTEEAPYVTRKTAHNHYGWTKALAEIYALEQNDISNNLAVTVVRPCSGVFGGDDRISVEQCLNLGVAPGIGSFCEMDWIYVENVVLGHTLAEAAVRKELAGEIAPGSVCGQAFNVSNNDPTTWIDFWHLVQDTLRLQFSDGSRKKVKIEFCFVPMKMMWGIAYFSESVQRVFKGKVSLGADIDQLTPAMLSTSTMSYTYGSDKAHKVLGYIPAYTLDEGVQKAVEEYYTIKVEKQPLW